MRALPTILPRRTTKLWLGFALILIALGLLSVSQIRTSEAAGEIQKPRPLNRILANFPANAGTLGAIPDSPTGGTVCGDYTGAPLNVTFTVSGLSNAAPSNVAVSFTGTHSWIGDLDVTLRGPGGTPVHTIFDQVLAAAATDCGDTSDLGGPYTFTDTAPAAPTFWDASNTAGAAVPVAAGNYRSTTPGGAAGGGAVTNITTAFSSVTNPNGTWTLRIHDGGSGDTGSVTAATLTVETLTVGAGKTVDFDGDGKTDPAVVRNIGGGPSGQIAWFIRNSLTGTQTSQPWGINGDRYVPEDYDGDLKTDIAVWRSGDPFNAYFYILQSSTNTLRSDQFGQTGDDPSVVGDYDGDGKADVATFRNGTNPGDHSFWFYRSSINGLIIYNEWGQSGDFPAPGDYDGDGKNDFVVQRNAGGGQAGFHIKLATGATSGVVFGTPTDNICPGDYDGDGKTDIAAVRGSGGQHQWFIRKSSDGATLSYTFGLSATDFLTQGDWDGDGTTDLGVWRSDADPSQNFFFWRRSIDGTLGNAEWGQNGDYPVANYNRH
jgi:subtilisin-like proprotein convertase family protein